MTHQLKMLRVIVFLKELKTKSKKKPCPFNPIKMERTGQGHIKSLFYGFATKFKTY
tara:strand:+ start:456 stop:623 length:168 start_codon:yes stop_codon:yes gene_type:complete